MEDGRGVRFLLEDIGPNARRAGLDDLEVSLQALERLHRPGIRHGDLNRNNILICEDEAGKRATLINSDNAKKMDQNHIDEMQKEIADLPDRLRDESGLGGIVESIVEGNGSRHSEEIIQRPNPN